MGLSASQGRMLLLTARKNDLEFRAQQISQRRLILSQQLEDISTAYEDATSNRQMKINLYGKDYEQNKYDTVSRNLSYAALVSGTVNNGLGGNLNGIVAGKNTQGQEYTSNTNYRLVSADGAIVVSDEDEIPKSYSKTTTGAAQTLTVSNSDAALNKMLKDSADEKITIAGMSYGTYKGTDDTEQDCIEVQYTDENGSTHFKYYSVKDGSELASKDGNALDQNSDGTADKSSRFARSETTANTNGVKNIKKTVNYSTEGEGENKKTVIKITSTTTTTVQTQRTEGNDGKWQVFDGENWLTYIVDEALAVGSTDSAGGSSGPNYLQDCLRNGKYLIEKGVTDNDEGLKLKWKSLSWDSASNINDNYYTDDDDSAKAKYDRLQSQIQNQDKKLELELDNIETQRSAVTTEIESVQKVIDDNVQDSFKIFNA